MKIERNVAIALLVGIVIGGVAIGVLDAKGPKPLFSSASEGSQNDPCRSYYDHWQNLLDLQDQLELQGSNASHLDATIKAAKKAYDTCDFNRPSTQVPLEQQ